MAGNDDKAVREARLAAKLRENLRKRKAQMRSLGTAQPGEDARGLPKDERDG